MLGELFPGRKLLDESGEDGDGQQGTRWDIDLDGGVVRLRDIPRPEPTPPGPAGSGGGPLSGPVSSDAASEVSPEGEPG